MVEIHSRISTIRVFSSQGNKRPPLPQQTGKKSGLKRCLEIYLFIGDDLIDQKEHPKREEKGKDIF
jgi:hypothetical protein